MKKIIITIAALALTSTSVFAKNECYILTENIVGSYSEETMARIQNTSGDQEKINVTNDAIQKNLAVPLKIGTKFCDAGEYNWMWYRKKINANGTFLWIRDNVLAEKI